MGKEKFNLEFVFNNVSMNALWSRLSTPSGLEEWFADNVSSKDGVFKFCWNKHEQIANLVSIKANSSIRFHWEDDDDKNSYFEFKIEQADLTKSVILTITDFADEDELDDAKSLWNSQIKDLIRNMGL